MRSMLKRIRRDERGQALIELALSLVLLLLLVAGVVDFGRLFNNYIIITNASREGARYASHFPLVDDEPGIKAATQQEAAGSGVMLEDGDITIDGDVRTAGKPIRVSVAYDFPTLLAGMFGFGDLTLRSSTEMIIFGLD